MLSQIQKSCTFLCKSLIKSVIALAVMITPFSHVQAASPFAPGLDPVPCDDTTFLPESEYDALSVFYTQLGGSNWVNRTNWGRRDVPVNTWFGVTCSLGHVTRLEFNANNLVGTLPGPELKQLSYLEALITYNDNGITGSIPFEIGDLANLRILIFGDNALSGGLPENLKNLKKLERLQISDQGIEGSIPTWIGDLSQLESLSLFYMPMSGPIPNEVCQLTSLKFLRILGINVTGAIPDCLKNLTQVEHIDLAWNRLSGTIPDIFGDLDNLITFNVELNYLTGYIPESITQSAHLVGELPLWECAFCYTNFNYNMLSASQPVKDFLDSIHSYWTMTQTVPPSDLQAVSESANSITLTWTPIPNNGINGSYYNIFYTSDPLDDESWVLYDRTINQNQASYEIENLLSGVPYYFKMNSFTPSTYIDTSRPPFISDYGEVVSATTQPGGTQIDVAPTDVDPKILEYNGAAGTTTVTIPAGAASQEATLSYVPITTNVGYNFTEKMFTLTAFQNSMPVESYPFTQPVSMQVGYSEAGLRGVAEEDLTILLYDPVTHQWWDAATSCTPASTYKRNLEENWVKVDICHLSLFALGDKQYYRISMPLVKR